MTIRPSGRCLSGIRALLALTALAPLAACGGDTMRSFGLTRDAPDEFQVTTRAPLSMPPSLGQLPVPRPGANRPQELDQRGQAEAALVPGAVLDRGGASRTSSGENALLSAAGQPVNDNIRRQVDEESLKLDQPDHSFVDSLMFWRSPDPPGTALDPRRESQRLRENAALGRDPSEGETPVIQPARSSNPVKRIFESIF
jgi:Protein of unknown function (DUF3035)